MVQKIVAILNRKINGVIEAAFLLGAFALISQVLGLFRDRALAGVLGPSSTLDIYYAAFRVPDFLFNSIASLVSITVLIPFMIERFSHDQASGTNSAQSFLNEIFSGFLYGMIIVSSITFLIMPYLAHFIAPGFSDEMLTKLIWTSRIMLLSPILLGLSNLFGTVTQMFRRFFVYALSPVCYNIGIIIGIFFFLPRFGVYGLALGVVLGAFLHLMIQVPVLIAHKFLPRLTNAIRFSTLKKVFLLSLPRTLALSLNSFVLIFIVAIASTIREGSISIFNFSYNLQAVPISIIGVSYSVAAFPMLASAFSSGAIQDFKNQIISASRQIIFWSLPVIVLFIVLRAQIVRVILGSGRFSWADTKLTAAALAIFALSVLAHSLIILFVRGYYAAGLTRRPLVVNLVFTALEIIFVYGFLWLFDNALMFRYFIENLLRVNDVPGTAILMLPLGYSLGVILNFFALWVLFKKDFLKGDGINLRQTFFQVFSASFIMGAVAYVFLGIFDDIFSINTLGGILGQGLFSGVIGILVGISLLYLMKNKELADVTAAFRKRFWKTQTFTPIEEGVKQ